MSVQQTTINETNKIIIMLDSCHSGGISNAFCFDANNYQQGIYILCSPKEAQYSYLLPNDKNSLFTKHLIKTLKGKFSCQKLGCNDCATRTKNLQQAALRKVTSTELVTYLNHAVTEPVQSFTYTTSNGSDFDISFLD